MKTETSYIFNTRWGGRGCICFALFGLHKSWKGFQDVASGRENFVNWERFCTDCIQEEIRRGMVEERLVMTDEEENCALTGKSSKAKGKKGQGETESSKKDKKKDLSKIKCLHCHEFGHHASKCLGKKKGPEKDHGTASTEVDDFFS